MKKKLVSKRGIVAVLVVLFIAFFIMLIPINLHAEEFWSTMIFASAMYCACNFIETSADALKERPEKTTLLRMLFKPFLVPIILVVAYGVFNLSGIEVFHAGGYASILQIEDAEFSEDLSESVGTDSIALMDTASAKMLGDREIGSLSNVVSQYDVSEEYSQIDYKGSPKKVAALDYVGFFKWLNNRKSGVPGYVTVDPVSMSAEYSEVKSGMKYVPSAYFLDDAARHIYLHYPTTMFGNLHFEIDEEGNPYYVASVYAKKVSLFGGKTVSGCIIMDPITGDMEKYNLEDAPTWVDEVYDGNTICDQYNWYGTLSNGYINSLISKKGCKQVTRYNASDSDDMDDSAPTSDYGYVAKDGDIWIYTGVTSVNNDSSNIGFLLANERTGEAHYFTVAGADEKSAMAAAEGEVQEKGYQASFPSLINVDGNPTYIMVLKDSSGLVKLYATVNVEQYNLVTTASTQSECMSKYKSLLGIAADAGELDVEAAKEQLNETSGNDDSAAMDAAGTGGSYGDDTEETVTATDEADITIAQIKYIDVDGNTYIYLIDADGNLYKAKAKNHESMLLLNKGDTVHISYAKTEGDEAAEIADIE